MYNVNWCYHWRWLNTPTKETCPRNTANGTDPHKKKEHLHLMLIMCSKFKCNLPKTEERGLFHKLHNTDRLSDRATNHLLLDAPLQICFWGCNYRGGKINTGALQEPCLSVAICLCFFKKKKRKEYSQVYYLIQGGVLAPKIFRKSHFDSQNFRWRVKFS